MKKTSSVRKTVAVNGNLLHDDRIAAGLSQEALLAGCDIAFHIGTLRRAEHSENISQAYLASIAKVLGQDVARYIHLPPEVSAIDGSIDITGDWTSFYVQDYAGRAPYVLEEKARFTLSSGRLTGYSESEYRGVTIREEYTNLAVVGDMLIGATVVRGWGDLTGASNIQVVIARGNDWMDGCTTWYDSDTRNIHYSRYILVRDGSRFREDFIIEAKALMAAEIKPFTARVSR